MVTRKYRGGSGAPFHLFARNLRHVLSKTLDSAPKILVTKYIYLKKIEIPGSVTETTPIVNC
jgi:hypothetical protein